MKQWKIPALNIESDICLLPMVDEQSAFFLRLHVHYRNRILFTEGGLTSQPNRYLEAMEQVEQLIGMNHG